MEINEKELLTQKLDEEIKSLDIKKQNLITSIRDLEVQRESARKIDEVEIQRERNKSIKETAKLKNSLTGGMERLEQKKTALNEREASLVRRESEVKDAKSWLDKLATERAEVYELRRKSERMMAEAQEKMEIVKANEESYQAKRDELTGREKAVEQKEKWWNDRIGELEMKEKEMKMEMADLEALRRVIETEEVSNV